MNSTSPNRHWVIYTHSLVTSLGTPVYLFIYAGIKSCGTSIMPEIMLILAKEPHVMFTSIIRMGKKGSLWLGLVIGARWGGLSN